MNITRRDFFLTGLAAFIIPKNFHKNAFTSFPGLVNDLAMGPIQNIGLQFFSKDFTGDSISKAHDVLWDRENFIKRFGGLPPVENKYDVIIAGSGLAGLSSAHYLSGQKILALEGHKQTGGNAKGEIFQGTTFGLGSAYLTLPDEGSLMDQLLKDLGLNQKFRIEDARQASVSINNKTHSNFWIEHETVFNRFKDIRENSYPDVFNYEGPWDGINFAQWMKNEFPQLHPHVEEFFHQYCWSSLGGDPAELSSAQVISFLASDLGGIMTLPGGNALIAQKLYEKNIEHGVEYRNSSFVIDIREDNSGVRVTYFDETSGRLKAHWGSKCVVAMPKFAAKSIVQGLPQSQFELMNSMKYRGYLVANVLLSRKVKSENFDTYCLNAKVPSHAMNDSKLRVFTDIIDADWANDGKGPRSILTLYLPMPYSMSHQQFFLPNLFDKYDEKIRKTLAPYIEGNSIEAIRMTRFGHAMILAEVEGLNSQKFKKAHAALNDKIVFAGQDNWGNPCFETALQSAHEAAGCLLGR